MNLLQRYLLKQFVPVCVVALLFFVLMLQLGDLFANLWKYLSNEVPLRSVVKVLLLYAPKCVSFALPLSVLFAAAYTMGNMYARNELTSIFASGYPLYLLILPLLVVGLLLSFGMFYFEDRVVIQTLSEKNNLNRLLLKQQQTLSNTNIVVLSHDGKIIYTADYYQDADKKLYSLFVVERDQEGNIVSILQSPSARWIDSKWQPEDFIAYLFADASDVLISKKTIPMMLDEPPETFQRNVASVEELTAPDAKKYIQTLKKAGLPFSEHLANYYKRFSFPLTIFIVLLFSISLGGRFKKNIMLMSLLLSLSIAVLYYVTQMITMLFAKWEYISPLAGAWSPVLLFIIASIVILKYART